MGTTRSHNYIYYYVSPQVLRMLLLAYFGFLLAGHVSWVILRDHRLMLHCMNSLDTIAQGTPWLARDFQAYRLAHPDARSLRICNQVRDNTGSLRAKEANLSGENLFASQTFIQGAAHGSLRHRVARICSFSHELLEHPAVTDWTRYQLSIIELAWPASAWYERWLHTLVILSYVTSGENIMNSAHRVSIVAMKHICDRRL